MNFLLIGGNGFIGSHLIDVLIENKHKVRVYDLYMERYRSPLNAVDYRIHSIDDISSLYEAMLDIDIVFHLASSSVPSTSNLDPILDVNANLVTSLNILNTAVRAKIKKIVYFSSGGAIYGNSFGLIDENSHLNPISSYGIIKSTVEKYFLLYSNLYNIKTIIFRPSNPYGPRQSHFIAQGVISTFLKKLSNSESINVFGNGDNFKDYIYVEDLAFLCYKITISEKEGIYNIGTGIGTSVNQIIDIIKDVTTITPKIEYDEIKNYDVPHFTLDISKAKQVVGNYIFSNLKVGIMKTWNWINEPSNNFNK
jgi:UDP-glucose 4-epimerase